MDLRLILISLIFVCPGIPAIAEENLPVLHKGINLSSWLANAPRQPLDADDFRQIKEAGFDHVRLPVNPELAGFQFHTSAVASPMDFAALDHALSLASEYQLPVILDLHPGNDFMRTLQTEPEAEEQFIALWVAIARHYKHYPSSALLFELLNEPQYYGAEPNYQQLVERLAAAIRAQDPKRVLVIGGPHGSSVEGLALLQPLRDERIFYDFHFYEPYAFTHQGTHQGFEDRMLRYFQLLPYPSSRVDKPAASYAPAAPSRTQTAQEIAEYVQAGWNGNALAARLQKASDWAERHHAHLLCGEFGVLRAHADPDSRYRWIADVRRALDTRGIGWELWDYADLFGIVLLHGKTSIDPADDSVRFVDAAHGVRTIEPMARTALGLGK